MELFCSRFRLTLNVGSGTRNEYTGKRVHSIYTILESFRPFFVSPEGTISGVVLNELFFP